MTVRFTPSYSSDAIQNVTIIFSHTMTCAWSPNLRLEFDTSELITDKSDTSQSYRHFLVHSMSKIINLTRPHVNHYPPHMTTFCQFKVLLFFSVFYQLTLTVIVLQTVNTTLIVWRIITGRIITCKTSKSIYITGTRTTHYKCLFSAGIKPKVQKLHLQSSCLHCTSLISKTLFYYSNWCTLL